MCAYMMNVCVNDSAAEAMYVCCVYKTKTKMKKRRAKSMPRHSYIQTDHVL